MASVFKHLHNTKSSIVLAPHGHGAFISITPDYMSYNARRLGDVADEARHDLSYYTGGGA